MYLFEPNPNFSFLNLTLLNCDYLEGVSCGRSYSRRQTYFTQEVFQQDRYTSILIYTAADTGHTTTSVLHVQFAYKCNRKGISKLQVFFCATLQV